MAVIGSVRFEENSGELRAELILTPADSSANAPSPTFMGTGMLRPNPADYSRYVSKRTLRMPDRIRFSVPRAAGQRTEIDLAFTTVTADSIPSTISKAAGTSFPGLAAPLEEGQNLEVFFEPVVRANPHRLLVTGPFSGKRISLNKNALTGIPTGEYLVYLIRQQLDKGERDGLRYSVQTEYFTLSKRVVVTE